VAPFVVPAAIKRVWDERGFDLLRVHSLRYIGPGALWARRRFNLDVPVVSHHHHLDASPLNRIIEKRVVEVSDRVVVGSEFGKRQLAAELGVRTDHVCVVHYGVDAAFAPGSPRSDLLERYGLRGHPVVLFFGGLKPRKNLFFLLDVWAPVAALKPEARLVIAGGGPLRPPLERHARRLGLEGRVVFTGYVPEAEKAAHFALADIFLFPSAMEGFGFSVAEAMSAGVPVVASDRGSIPELVAEGQSGFVCDPSMPDRFVERLLVLLGDAALREKFGAAALERADRLFRWEACVDGTRRVYEETLEAWRRRSGRPGP
jgi:glycosyltransferase involved in cell wall biosynthesis